MIRVRNGSNLFSGLFLSAFSIIFILLTPSQVPLYEASDALSPRLFPYVVFSLIGIFGVALIVTSLQASLKSEEEYEVSETSEVRSSLKDLLIFLAIGAFVVFSAEFIGFTFASVVALVAALAIYGVRPWYMILLVGVLVPISIELGYRLLGIYLPLGFWENLIY